MGKGYATGFRVNNQTQTKQCQFCFGMNVFMARNTFLYLPSGQLLINKNKKTKLQILLLLWNSREEFKDLNRYC